MMQQTTSSLSLNQSYPYRVLIVDDDPIHRLLECEILQAPKYSVLEACGGEQAIALLGAQCFDVVLLDKYMPGLNGDQVCQIIRKDLGLSMLPIIMVTGSTSASELTASLQNGANDFIRKPYNPIELTARVDSAVAQKRLTDTLEDAESVLFALARMVNAKDDTTGEHCSRVARNCVIFGKYLGLNDNDLQALRHGGVLHDIGKLGIPDAILLKPGKLTEPEWKIMQSHTTIGWGLIDGLHTQRLTAPIVRHHHERWDGSGYPDGLRGEEIPILARVFQLIDIYDALAYERPYKPALDRHSIIRIFQEETAKGWRQPELVKEFLSLLETEAEQFATSVAANPDLGASLYQNLLVS